MSNKQTDEKLEILYDTYGRNPPEAVRWPRGIVGADRKAAQEAQDARRHGPLGYDKRK